MNKFNKLRKIALHQHRCFSNSVYLWGSMPRLGPKSSDLK
jgi:alpha-tubulin suppressor-like RCC1 family protein